MRGIHLDITGLARLAVLIFVCLSSTAFAENRNHIGAGGGLFSPSKGDSGTSFAFQYAHKLGTRHYIGAEFEYRKFDGELFNVENLALKTYNIRAIYRIDTVVNSLFTPYFGIGLGFGINTFDTDKVEAALEARFPGASASVPSVGGGIGIQAVVGLDVTIPSTPALSVYGEARLGYVAQFSQIQGVGDEELKVENLGGVTLHGGLRLSF